MKTYVFLLCCLFALTCVIGVDQASAQNLTTTWAIVDDQGMCNGCFFPETWTATTDTTVVLTDLFVVGDSYGVYLNGVLAFNTPGVCDWTCYGDDPTGFPYTTDPNQALNSGLFSSAIFFVSAGTQITLTELSLPTGFTDGTYAIMATPEPTSLALLGSGVLGLAGFARRKLLR